MIVQYESILNASEDLNSNVAVYTTNQYETYSEPSSAFISVVANSISPLEEYIVMRTGEYEYTALIKNLVTHDVEKIVCTRSNSSYSSYYTISRSHGDDFEYSVSNEYYVYSNVGYGRALDIPSYEGIVTFGVASLTCLVFLAVMFKGVIFKCLRRRR